MGSPLIKKARDFKIESGDPNVEANFASQPFSLLFEYCLFLAAPFGVYGVITHQVKGLSTVVFLIIYLITLLIVLSRRIRANRKAGSLFPKKELVLCDTKRGLFRIDDKVISRDDIVAIQYGVSNERYAFGRGPEVAALHAINTIQCKLEESDLYIHLTDGSFFKMSYEWMSETKQAHSFILRMAEVIDGRREREAAAEEPVEKERASLFVLPKKG